MGKHNRRALRLRELMAGSGARYLGSAFAVAASVLASFLTPLLVAGAVDAVTDTANGNAAAAVNLPGILASYCDARGGAGWLAARLWLPAGLVVLVSLVGGLFQYLKGKWSAEASEAVADRLRCRLYGHLLAMGYDYHAKAETGDLIQRCTTDVDTVRRFLASQLVEILRTLVMVALALALMLSIHPGLTLFSLILVPPIFALALWFFHWVQKLFAAADAADGKLTAMLQESMTGVRVVRAFGRQQYESDRFDACADEVYDRSVEISRVMAVYWSGTDMLGMLQTGVTLVAGIAFARAGEITTGDVLVFVSYVSMLIWPIRQLGRILQDLGKARVALARIREILDAPAEADTPGASPAPLRADITFRDVTFAYDPEHPVLKGVSFTAKAGQTVAILGPTGSGKSTLMHLLQRLYDPDGGEILIGGREIRTIDKRTLRSRVGYVLQEPFLFSRSLRDNVALARPDASEDEVREAARITASEGFIESFEKGWDTLVGERGVTLSGGQKQRIAMARTLLRDNDILILDDSLSAVDTETDRAIREALRESRAGDRAPTTFIISHRIPTLADADWILVLEDGRVTQQGTHAQLIDEPGLYRRVYRIQAALEEELNREAG